jgi:hypothetical protein
VQTYAYDSDDLRLLSAALSAAMGVVRNYAGGPLTPTETSDFNRRLARNLMTFFDSGERDPAALERAALQGVLWAPATESNGAAGRGRTRIVGTLQRPTAAKSI